MGMDLSIRYIIFSYSNKRYNHYSKCNNLAINFIGVIMLNKLIDYIKKIEEENDIKRMTIVAVATMLILSYIIYSVISTTYNIIF